MYSRLVFACLLLAGCADRSLGLDDDVISHPPNKQGCTGEAPLTYSVANNVVPEMNDVWAWFDEHAKNAISVSDFNPARYCAF